MKVHWLFLILPVFLGCQMRSVTMTEWNDAGWRYRREIVVRRAKETSADLRDFPVLVIVKDEDLKNHVSQSGAADVLFVQADGGGKLDHEIGMWDSETGELAAWVRLPVLSSAANTVIFLYYGNPSCEALESEGHVWDSHTKMVLRARDPGGRVRAVDAISREITVEAWISSETRGAEGVQALVSKWAPLATFDTFEAYDAGNTSGLDTTGFLGAVFDGRYVYFVPQHDKKRRHGKVLRYDTHGTFRDPASWAGHNAERTSGLDTRGYYGGAFDGRYVHLVARTDGKQHHTRMLRYDTHGAFADGASWKGYDIGLPVSHQSCAFDGRYVYLAPGYRQTDKGHPTSGEVIRYDTRRTFDDKGSYVIHDVAGTSGLATTNFDGAVFDGRYVYFVPLSNKCPLRYDTRGGFSDKASWTAFDAGYLGMRMCVGGVYDGRYVYYAPYGDNPVVVRYDVDKEFTEKESWSAYTVAHTGGLQTTGFDGAAFDGRYVYFVPFWDMAKDFHGTALRYDTQAEFLAPDSWRAFDAGSTDGLATRGYNGGAFDGRYVYFAPWHDGKEYPPKIEGHGRMLRYDTVGENGSFSLRYADSGHNGGLCAALPGPRFIVNTNHGAVSVAVNRIMEPGMHHLAGVYDGETIRLFVDGKLAGERQASGAIQTNAVPIVVGRIADRTGVFKGKIRHARISDTARSAARIATEYRNLRAPSAFCSVGREEERD